MKFIGEFETHLTVEIVDSLERDRRSSRELQQWARDRQLKFLHIILDRGVNNSQPMLTRRGKGRAKDELKIALDLARLLDRDGFKVVRIKIEAAPWSEGIPRSNLAAQSHPPDRYFEHHLKLVIPNDADILLLTELAQKHGGHLSRNALQIRENGDRERFITQRCQNVGKIVANQKLQALLAAVSDLGYQPIDVEEEFVIYDSNFDLDRGWIDSD